MESQNIHPDKKIQYTIDLTRGYHNLLQKEEVEKTQSYLWGGNVVGLREDSQESYYLLGKRFIQCLILLFRG